MLALVSMIKYFICWFLMLILAFLNGTARDLGYKKYMSELTAHQISTFTLIIIFGFFIGFVINKFPPVSGEQAVYIGLLWLFLTLGFEFGFGLMRGNTLAKLLEDYNLLKGRLWILIPLWIAIAPYLFYQINK